MTGKEDGVTDCTRLAVKVIPLPSCEFLKLRVKFVCFAQVLKTSFDSQAKLRTLIGLGTLVSSYIQLLTCL